MSLPQPLPREPDRPQLRIVSASEPEDDAPDAWEELSEEDKAELRAWTKN